jgi:hypothetical protein
MRSYFLAGAWSISIIINYYSGMSSLSIMKKGNPKKRHHIISSVYLEKWKDPKQLNRDIVFSLDKKSLKAIGSSPKNILVEKHYFTESQLNGTRSHPVEDYLGEDVENKFNKFVCGLELIEPIEEETKKYFWRFVLSMFTRVLWLKERLQSLVKPALEQSKHKAINQLVQKHAEGKNRSGRRQAKSSNYRAEISAEIEKKVPSVLKPLEASIETQLHPLAVMASLSVDESYDIPFKIVRSKKGSFISSDTPCFSEEDPFLLSFDGERAIDRAFICPLSPNLVFVGGAGLTTGYSDVDSEWVRRFNARVRANAKEKLIANTNLVDESWFLDNPDSPPTMKEVIDGLELPNSKAKRKGFG